MPFDSEIAPKVEVNATTFVGTSTQIELENMYSKSQLLDTIRHEFIEAGFEAALAEKDIDTDFGIEFLTQLYLHTRKLRRHSQNSVWRNFVCLLLAS